MRRLTNPLTWCKRWFQRTVLSRAWLTFIVMGLSFFAFGVGSLNLFYMMQANTQLLLEYGWMGIMDGGLRQLLELLGTGYACVALYTIFKTCEYRLAHWLGDEDEAEEI